LTTANWLRAQQFKKGERVDFAKTEKEVYEKYKREQGEPKGFSGLGNC
jgi:hypothetical protein